MAERRSVDRHGKRDQCFQCIPKLDRARTISMTNGHGYGIQMKTNQNNARDRNEEKTKNIFLNENQKPKLLHIYADRRRRKIGRLSRDSPQRRLSEDEKKTRLISVSVCVRA